MSLILSGDNGVSDIDGSAATPAIRGTDANTGIFFPAADTIAFSEGGTEAVRIDSSGNVGIGTASPSGKLDVVLADNGNIDIRQSASASTGFLSWVDSDGDRAGRISYDHSTNALRFATASSGTAVERMRIDSSGNLLVNTTTAQTGAKLSVTGGISGTITSGTAVSASGTSIDFTGIPSWVKRITVMFAGVSTSGTSVKQIQLGTSSGVVTTGYLSGTSILAGTVASLNVTTGIGLYSIAAADNLSGAIFISNITGNTWVSSGTLAITGATNISVVSSGSLALGGTLDRVRITTVNGTDTFDAGSINILYEG
jgi:hypothetical protein